ncbi:hypothetical protein J4E82_008804 [Alternaria postmessia]|jgi:hypothetical protein|uniref:uncharacterized protein n=1 Tax=Alternaria postmessia TaxID=1187938 RepID=UPI0022240AD3|nr:uncharacterized protein J4E82_008804 [Alternaria postmessia]KAI5372515.1 hypothetical protein J4E82_008804 [Alternaria postmessia]
MTDAQTIFDVEAATAAPKRYSDTNIQTVHQVIAISEDSLNSVLATRFDISLKRKKDKRLRDFHHAIPDNGEMIATLGVPRIQMSVPEAPESVYFYLNLKNGFFEYWTGTGPRAEKKKQDVTGWSIAFKTSFSLAKLAAVPEEIAEKITILHPGSYSASQILLSFSAAATAELIWSASKCPGMTENSSLKVKSQNMFEEYMKTYIGHLATGPYSVLGYAINVDDKSALEKLAAPSFPATKVKCSTQDYVPQTDQFKKFFPQRGGLDALIFEEMTGISDFPDLPYYPSKAGNWIVGGVNASLTMSKKIFWEDYLLEKLKYLNMQCITVANDSWYWVRQWKDLKMTGNDWILDKDSKPTSAPWVSGDSGATFNWTTKNLNSENSLFGGQWRDNWDTTIANAMQWDEAKSTVNISVSIAQNRDHWNGGHGGGTDSLSGGKTKIAWKMTVDLSTIKDGELDVAVTTTTPELSYIYDSTSLAWDWLFGGSGKASFENAAKNTMTQGIDTTNIASDLKTSLAGQSKFVFPGAGDFFMKDAKFNKRGDLLINLSFIAKEIAIDEHFYLQVSSTDESLKSKWIKVNNDQDDSPLRLVGTQQEATLFQVDNGNLVVDKDGSPTGSVAITRALVPANDRTVDLLFVTQATNDSKKAGESDDDFAARRIAEKVEVSRTGDSFSYSVEKGKWRDNKFWMATYALDYETKSKVQLYVGDPKDNGPYTVFELYAVFAKAK